MTASKRVFLSAVSSEFGACRALLARDLARPDLEIKEQEHFLVSGGTTMAKLDAYIKGCDGVIHLVGKASGAVPEQPAVTELLAKYTDFATRLPPLAEALASGQPGFSYTQWEAYLTLYHGRQLFVYRPTDFELDALDVPRGDTFRLDPAELRSQREHYARICALGHDRGQFLNEERLSSAVLRDLVEILPRLQPSIQVPPTRLRHTAERLIGRDHDLTRLDAAWNDPHKNVVIVRAFGGMGKTSLVATWMAELASKDWRGAERVYDWSFYSQGTSDQRAASADRFIADALKTFGDPDPTIGSAWDRGARLAGLVASSRCLLVLDGLEPLQYPPGPMHGRLKDPGVEALLKGLAAHNTGLCVVTTREKVDDIQQHYGRTADDFELTRLSDVAGAALLHHVGARRVGAKEVAPDHPELQAASRDVHGHGLTLQLLGQYLQLAEGGDIQKRDTVRIAEADREFKNDAGRSYGHAFKAMEAYERWFEREGERGARQLAILRLLGLFDRPASPDCLEALSAAPPIAGLTEALVDLARREWQLSIARLEHVHLVTRQADGSLDAHPLLREFFAQRVKRQRPAGWREAHRRLYEHLCAHTREGDQPDLEALQPLYQAVAHGCEAGLQQQACDVAYFQRINRGHAFYSTNNLGAFGSDLGAVACFFEQPWSRVSTALTEDDQAWLLNAAAYRLRALGRLEEALEPMRSGLEMRIRQKAWVNAAISASNLSELELTIGGVSAALDYAERSVSLSRRIEPPEWQSLVLTGTTRADALHQAGRRDEAVALFRQAEAIQVESQPAYSLLYSLQGFQYCDRLLAAPERGAWQRTIGSPPAESSLSETCQAVSERASQTLQWVTSHGLSLLTVALDHLTLARASLYAAILRDSPFDPCQKPVSDAVDGLRLAGQLQHLPLGLLTRAWLRALTGSPTGPDSAQSDLDEAFDIAERGPMPLFLADIHLHRARLFAPNLDHATEPYPWQSPEHDLAEARRLIEKHGYGRRLPELEDAEAAILSK